MRRIYDKAKQYENVVDLTLGDPDIPTPKLIIDATNKALNENKTKYTANAGVLELRQAVSEDVKRRTAVTYTLD